MEATPQRVLVIGGGPTGLVTLRNLKEIGGFGHVELYERRDDVGGVWYFDEKEHSKSPSWPSPAYPGLVGNVLPEYLSFSGFPFPEPPSSPMQPFPTLLETYQYLRAFASPYLLSGDIKLLREVVSVSELEGGKGWSVVSRDWRKGGHTTEEVWDAVVVSVGWYDNPIWPETEGLDELRRRGIAHHSKWWRGPTSHRGKRVLVVGNANSSNDIAGQLAPVASTPVYQSIRRPGALRFPCLPDARIRMVAPVAKYALCPDGARFDAHLADGTVLTSLDAVHIGTGYRPFPSFVHVLAHISESHDQGKSPSSSLLAPLASESVVPPRVPSLHRMVMYAYNPSLAFVGATMANTPFTIADLSSTWLALAWRGEVAYPSSPAGRLVFEADRLREMDAWRAQHDSSPSAQVAYSVLGASEEEYARTMRAQVVRARPELGAVLPVWNGEMTKRREGMYQVKYNALEYTRAHSA